MYQVSVHRSLRFLVLIFTHPQIALACVIYKSAKAAAAATASAAASVVADEFAVAVVVGVQ